MMGAVSLIPSTGNDHPAPHGGNAVHIIGQNRMSLMISKVCSQAKADHKRPYQGDGIAFQIFQRYQKVTFRISRRPLGYLIKFL